MMEVTTTTTGNLLEPQTDDDDEEEDVVIQEVNVFLSSISIPNNPNSIDLLTTTTTTTTDHRTYLMQYPGHWKHHQQQQHHSHQRHDDNNNNNQAELPISIGIKPRHNIIEAEHSIVDPFYIHTTNTGSESGSPTTRTYESQTIPMNTHLCFGKYITTSTTSTGTPTEDNNSITELHLIPITHVTQMRPSFQHLTTNHEEEEEENDDEDHDKDDHDMIVDESNKNTNNNNNNNNNNTTTITYQRKESDRAIAARKSSYAYQKQSQDNEPFIPLQVVVISSKKNDIVNDSLNNTLQPQPQQLSRHASLAIIPETTTTTHPIFLPNRDPLLPANMSYIQSLNYLIHPTSFNPSSKTTQSTTTTLHQQQQQHPTLTNNNNNNSNSNDPVTDNIRLNNNERKRILTRIMTILQFNNGPIPFSILLLSILQNENVMNHHHGQYHSMTTHHDVTTPSPSSTTTTTTTSFLLLSILNSIAVLVQGNWYIHSKFMKIIPHPSILRSNRKQASSSMSLHQGGPSSLSSSTTSVIIVGSNTNQQQFIYKQLQQRIRTFALLLLHLYGKIYKARFIQAYNSQCSTTTTTTTTPDDDDKNDNDDHNKNRLFTILLHQIAKPTKDGYWVGKIQEDVSFPQLYPDTIPLHDHYWNQQQTLRFQKELLHYNSNI